MKEAMDKMEEERADMIAEVEAQIERALAHMAVDVDESDYGSSRPSSRLSSRSAPSGTLRRRPSDGMPRPLRSFSTESTLAESYHDGKDDGLGGTGIKTVPEVEEEEEDILPSKKRFSASKSDLPQDGMSAVDEGISQKSDKIAQKVLQIQRKLENALAADAQRRSLDSHASESEFSEAARSSSSRRRRPSRTSRQSSRTIGVEKLRSITMSPTGTSTGRSTPVRHNKRVSEDRKSIPIEEKPEAEQTPTKEKHVKQEVPIEEHKVSLPGLRRIPSNVSIGATRPPSPSAPTPITPSLTTATSTATDDEDTDFQSAYSASPRGSYGSFENFAVKTYDNSDSSEAGTPTTTGGSPDHLDDFGRTSRDRAMSTATAKDTKGRLLRASQDTVTATPRLATR